MTTAKIARDETIQVGENISEQRLMDSRGDDGLFYMCSDGREKGRGLEKRDHENFLFFMRRNDEKSKKMTSYKDYCSLWGVLLDRVTVGWILNFGSGIL